MRSWVHPTLMIGYCRCLSLLDVSEVGIRSLPAECSCVALLLLRDQVHVTFTQTLPHGVKTSGSPNFSALPRLSGAIVLTRPSDRKPWQTSSVSEGNG